MKKKISILLVFALVLSFAVFTGCGASSDSGEASPKNVVIKPSPDKYTWYVKNYVGLNLASVGYYSMGGDIRDEYGEGTVKIVPVTEDGSFIDAEKEEELQKYKVTGQNQAPNTEIKYTFEKDEDGEEYDSLVETQSIDEIVLTVKPVSGSSKNKDAVCALTTINPSPDKYTAYCKDYVGRNLRFAGYISMGGELRDEYGQGNIKLNILTDDGTYIDPTDENKLKKYYVVSQSVEPNTEIKFTFEKDEDGEEYDNLVETQSIDVIEINVKKVEGEK